MAIVNSVRKVRPLDPTDRENPTNAWFNLGWTHARQGLGFCKAYESAKPVYQWAYENGRSAANAILATFGRVSIAPVAPEVWEISKSKLAQSGFYQDFRLIHLTMQERLAREARRQTLAEALGESLDSLLSSGPEYY